ncbi:hypothetical protein PPL_10567 [Heterostelium album PN500]|uniref:Uncharacterized protein n=1 Tax=Heterostelium pallidum (strain ATCC 26659 / Pp 5 / PN500) TaxID=670386 RepID=D3BRF7_HETP5|nr:hypothetical protein PPL_10567 [Heterostelium album PN500]EFA75989.1 hypothetical protein PPL_10567 [Heterostelium album PN500]|eukprot:XP_020428123.1 hypothetical protein PPL_10567 [Heterostelium album PN500]
MTVESLKRKKSSNSNTKVKRTALDNKMLAFAVEDLLTYGVTDDICKKYNISKSSGYRYARQFIETGDIRELYTAQEDISRNTPIIINDRYTYANLLLKQGKRPDPDHIIYYDVTYFETNLVARKGRAPKGKPVVNRKGHRGFYVKMPTGMKQTGMKRKTTEAEAEAEEEEEEYQDTEDIEQEKEEDEDDGEQESGEIEEKFDYVNGIPFTKKPTTRGGKAETIAVVCALNVRGGQYRTIGDLLTAIGNSFKKIQPENLENYHKTVEHYLYLSLDKLPIHSWRVTLDNKVKVPLDPPERQWDYAHQTIFMAEKERLDTPLAKDDDKNQPKESKNFMLENGQKVFIYKQNEEPTSYSVTTKNKTTAKKPTKTTKRLPKKLKKSTKTTKKST